QVPRLQSESTPRAYERDPGRPRPSRRRFGHLRRRQVGCHGVVAPLVWPGLTSGKTRGGGQYPRAPPGRPPGQPRPHNTHNRRLPMAEYKDREHYIPLRKSDLIDLLCNDKGLSPQQRSQLRQFCTLVVATYHFEYLKLLDDLKNEYAPFDPDSVTVTIKRLGTEERAAQLDELFGRFGWLMERANFAHLGKDAIEKAMQEVSDWGLNMEVNFDVFERLDIYVRGDGMGTRYRRRWRNFLRREAVRVPTYQRLVLIMNLRPHKQLPPDIDTRHVFLKIFKDIPKADLEM